MFATPSKSVRRRRSRRSVAATPLVALLEPLLLQVSPLRVAQPQEGQQQMQTPQQQILMTQEAETESKSMLPEEAFIRACEHCLIF